MRLYELRKFGHLHGPGKGIFIILHATPKCFQQIKIFFPEESNWKRTTIQKSRLIGQSLWWKNNSVYYNNTINRMQKIFTLNFNKFIKKKIREKRCQKLFKNRNKLNNPLK